MTQSDDNPNIVLTDKVEEIKCKQCGCEIDVAELAPFTLVECPDCGNIETVPARLGQFLLINLIGRGGMGGVYQAIDESLGRKVAIKVMLRSLGENKNFVETFKKEAQAVAKLNHPNIVQIYSFGQEKGQPYIVMELVSGGRFDKLVDSGQVLEQSFVMQVGLDIAEALKAADEIGLQHGDVKPENILLDEKSHAKLVDFGLATFAHQDEPEGIWGTPYYIAPEKVQRKKTDGRSDIYSLGATLYHALAGRPPFEGKTPIEVVKARLERPPPPLSYYRKDIDKQVESIIMRMLEQHPAKRYPTYASLISDLQKVVKTLGPAKKTIAGMPVTARITLRKKRSSPITIDSGTVAKTETALPPPPAPSTKVLVKAPLSTHKTGSALDRYKTKATGLNLGTPQAPAKKGKVWKKVMWTFLTMLILGGIAGGGIYYKMERDKTIEQRREQFTLLKTRNEAETTFIFINTTATNTINIINKMESSLYQITNAVLRVTGKPLILAKPAEKLTTSNQPPQAIKESGDTTNASSNTVNTGQESTQPAAAVTDETPAEEEHEITKEAKKAIQNIKAVSEIKADIQGKLKSAIEELKKIRVAISSEIASASLKELSKIKTEITDKSDEINLRKKEWERHLSKISDIEKIVIEAELAHKKAEEEERKRKAEEEERLRKEAELKALIESELQLVENIRTTNMPLFRQTKFKELADSVRKQLRDFKTSEGKQAAETLMERYNRLDGMKKFYIEQLTKNPFKWGWIRSATSTEDILGADEEGVILKGRKVPWAEISIRQWIMIIQHYLASKDVRTRILGEQSLAAAIFMFENGNKEVAAKFLSKAIEYCPDLQEPGKKLVPIE